MNCAVNVSKFGSRVVFSSIQTFDCCIDLPCFSMCWGILQVHVKSRTNSHTFAHNQKTTNWDFNETDNEVMPGGGARCCHRTEDIKQSCGLSSLSLKTVGLMVSRCCVAMIAHVTKSLHNVHTVRALFHWTVCGEFAAFLCFNGYLQFKHLLSNPSNLESQELRQASTVMFHWKSILM